MGKLKTPDWVLEGFDSEDEYSKSKGIKKKKPTGKVFKIRKCPQCGNDDVSVVLGFEEGKGKGEWECKKCKWVGKILREEEVSEEEFIKYLDKMEGK